MKPLLLVLFLSALGLRAAAELPTITVTGPKEITESCRIVIPANTVISDPNGVGVLRITRPDITIEFAAGSVLRGAKSDQAPDTLRGYGVRIEAVKNVTIRGAHVAGFQCGIYARNADGLTIEDCDVTNIRRHHLRSTVAAEDGADWLWPHKNDDEQWVKEYGAAFCLHGVWGGVVRRCRVRDSQNGLILDRVEKTNVYDNDFSFLSGWGIAMWRSVDNTVSRNALDFCIRGYSHGVYNRGQDSAGILFFEQCSRNLITENSATHGGDGFFGFAGREAIGENWLDEEREKLRKETGKQDVDDLVKADDATAGEFNRKGCNDNMISNNDFSFAAAHGIELTFSFWNRIVNNQLIGNAICGIWGGYSQDTLIAENHIEDNGGAGYGLERGGINIEHGARNVVFMNSFRANVVGVHFWGGPNGAFDQRPWGRVNGSASKDNWIGANRFDSDKLALHFRGPGSVSLGPNSLTNVGTEMQADPAYQIVRADAMASPPQAKRLDRKPLGESHPVGARPDLAGRENIIMTEWGPWDHASPLVRTMQQSGARHMFELRKLPPAVQVSLTGAGVTKSTEPLNSDGDQRLTIAAAGAGIFPYHLKITAGEFKQEQDGVLIATKWSVVFFPWEIDPRKDLDGWRKLADGPDARKIETDSLSFKYAGGGPKNLKLGPAIADSKIGPDHFGMIARAKIPLTKGKWNFKTTSDDGVRVLADGKPIIENWAWHGPTTDTGVLELDADREVELVVEHFEIDGYAILDFDISPAPGK